MIDFAIINYNGGKSLADCVNSIKKMKGVSTQIFVYDNASKDNSLNDLGDDIRIERGEKNLGYAGACNALLLKMDSPIQVLCNMDLEFDENWGKEILTAFENNVEYGSIASLVMEKNGVINAVGVEFFPDMHAICKDSGKSINDVSPLKERPVFGCHGAVMAFRKEIAQKVGFLEDSFFLFYEETEWYLRHNLFGFRTMFCPSAVVWHERSKTTIRYSPLKLYYGERNRIRTAVHYLPLHYLFKLPMFSFKRYLKTQKETNHSNVTGNGELKKHSLFYLILILLKAWISGIFGQKPKIKLTSAHKKQVLAIIRNYAVDLKSKDLTQATRPHVLYPPPPPPPPYIIYTYTRVSLYIAYSCYYMDTHISIIEIIPLTFATTKRAFYMVSETLRCLHPP